MLSNHLSFCCPLLLPSIFPSIRVFSNKTALCIKWPKCWSFSFSISPSNEYSGLISFRIDWFDLLAVQGTLKSLLQHHSSKASILQCSAFLWSNSLHDYWNNHSFDYMDLCWHSDVFAFSGGGAQSEGLGPPSLLFNMLSRFVIAFLPRSKRLLISWLQSPSTVILEPRKENLSLPLYFPILFAMKWWDQMPWSLFFECWVISQLFHSPLLPSSRGFLVLLHFLPLEWCHLHICCC